MKTPDLASDAIWKQRYRISQIRFSRVATHMPSRGVVLSNKDGTRQLYAWDVPTGALRQITHVPTGVLLGFISVDGCYVYYHQDTDGSEIGHLVRVPFEGGEPEDLTPDLTPYPLSFPTESGDGHTQGFVAANDNTFQVFVIHDNTRKLLFKSEALTDSPQFSYHGDIAIVANAERSGKNAFSLIAFNVASGERIGELFDVEASITLTFSYAFSPFHDDLRVLASTDKSGYNRPVIWNPKTGERIDIPLTELDGECYPLGWSPDGKDILFYQSAQAKFQLFRYTLNTQTLTRLQHPTGTISDAYYVPSGDIFLQLTNASQPDNIMTLDGVTGTEKGVILKAGDAPTGHPWRSVAFLTTDGTPIQAWLVTPDGEGPFPTIVHTHGGPTWAQPEMYDPTIQAWVDHGFALLSVNYRGSTTFGKTFERAIWGHLGTVEVEDMAAGYHWLVENKIAQPDKVLLTGRSYGGFLTLQAIGREPDLWAGGIAEVAIADWTLMAEDSNEGLRGYQRGLFEGTPAEKPETHRIASPITYAADIKAPILVIQGSNDSRCPPRQMRVYEEKLKTLGKNITVHWFEAGHVSMANDEQIAHMEMMLQFAHNIVGDQ